MTKNREFLDWLDEMKFLLPPKMSMAEAWELFKRKDKEEKEINDNKGA